MQQPSFQDLFEPAISCPDVDLRERLNNLVGLDDHKERLSKILGLLINPKGIKDWAAKHHPDAQNFIDNILRRPPLVVLEGDVGSGKTELATTIGDSVARQENIEITILPLSLSTRGQGRVGEMTKLISSAFDYTIEQAKKLKSDSGKSRGAIILLIDEADALAQSRENSQMHHEDKAGVNSFIRGIDRIGNERLPAAVIMCTNRLNTLDPAVKRRAADILEFHRPNDEQRKSVLNIPLKELGFNDKDIEAIVKATGPRKGKVDYGFTYSDLMQRLLPTIVLEAYPDKAVVPEKAIKIAKRVMPTPPFNDN